MRNDRNHGAARRFLQHVLEGPASLVLHEWVFVEAMTLLKVRGGAEVAIRVGEEIKRNPLYRWQPSTPQLEQLAWGVFERYSDKDWSYTDRALVALAQQTRKCGPTTGCSDRPLCGEPLVGDGRSGLRSACTLRSPAVALAACAPRAPCRRRRTTRLHVQRRLVTNLRRWSDDPHRTGCVRPGVPDHART